ncbi:Bug family tripartite tricarboxylate transporter substrate binding protein [Alicycliphilus denitrificans]|uniref:Tripartite tricarboxylate transporter substrate binding protein n=1 Tax=Alicycliphilus denitrificans TaxID=179636 RepID=A0A420KAN7_9BURK|nr:tripartite tricarboxylate transporter substrate binding protein [Alicycliphilus denitrificans]RKJ96287.1 tripartite tricarboxylate transporter substrate binding protein [Alicycliphilus denitrificans]
MKKLACIAFASLLSSGLAHAQGEDNYPSRPITAILSSAPGGGSDIIFRYLTTKLTPILGQPFVMDNKPGANGAIAMTAVKRAKPDGYTLTLGASASHVMNPVLYANLPYHPVKDFTAIGQLGTVGILLAASNDFPANNLKELAEVARKQKEPLQYASYGIGSTGHFCGEVLAQMSGYKLSHVPFKTVPQVISALIAGDVKVGFTDMTAGSAAVKNGQIKALASCTSKTPSLPGVGGYVDQGIDFDRKFRWVLYGPAGMPEPVAKKLRDALNTVLAMPDVIAKFREFGISAEPLDGDKVNQIVERDIADWREIARKGRITAE